MLDGLLNTLTNLLDIREVFARVSQVAQRVLPHDVLGVGEFSESGARMLHAQERQYQRAPSFVRSKHT